MFPRPLRLTRKAFAENRGLERSQSSHFHISYKEPVQSGGSLIVVPKKIVKSAVGRHLLKRRLKAIVRPWSTPNRVLVISTRKGVQDLSYDQLSSELSSALQAILAK